MHLKRFCRPTTQEALRAAREELGPDALVLSTRSVSAGGLRGWMGRRSVEITAAVERRDLSEERIEPSVSRPAAIKSEMAARLEASGLDPDIARLLAEHPTVNRRGAGTREIHSALVEELGALALPKESFAAVEVFMGPPGVGKTTTIAKIAAQARVRQDARFGLVAADGFRVGAVEQLRLFADIIGSPFTVARSGAELSAALAATAGPLLVDTAGRSPNDAGAAEILDTLAGRPGVRRHLVLPAATPGPTVRRIIERFRSARPDRIVITRLDEVDSLAPVIGVLRDLAVPISYLTNGQNVPDDLQRATPAALADWVIGQAVEEAYA